MQNLLSTDQIKSFHIDVFVQDQINNFSSLVDLNNKPLIIVDVGGGIGCFAAELKRISGISIRVIDSDADSISIAKANKVDAEIGDAANPPIVGNEDIACFNLILHHLVASSELETIHLQIRCLALWRETIKAIFVNEYIYESYFNNLSGRMIYEITKNRFLSFICKKISQLIPSLHANTFGVGVRFRSHDEWIKLFDGAGYKVKSLTIGAQEFISLPRRLLLIKEIRRDSFLLVPDK